MLSSLSLPVQAAAPAKLTVAVNQSQLLNLPGVERVAVANPEIADVVVVSGYEVLLVGKSPGVTTLHTWVRGNATSYLVEVGANDVQIAGEIRSLLGYGDIRVSKVGKNIILEGIVNDQYQKMRAEKVASAYGEKVVNLLEITRPIQVKIEARVIEISREKLNNLGIKWGNYASTQPGTFLFGQGFPGSSSNPVLGSSPPGKTVLGGMGGYMAIDGLLDALIKNNMAKMLSQPNIITLSGDKASIMVGGQIPVPISSQNGSVSVEWKDYGIKLDISPEVAGDGLISSKIKAEVSTLDWSSEHLIGISAGMKIPPVLTRKAETAIALSSGQTMAIGGLISSETSRDVYKVPLLADIPILGKLFTSTSFSRGETELIILITPTIVNPQEYIPSMSKEMLEKTKEKPWGGTGNGDKN
jgi:pilus assembly protein CpaC